jgi:hypothetical protein
MVGLPVAVADVFVILLGRSSVGGAPLLASLLDRLAVFIELRDQDSCQRRRGGRVPVGGSAALNLSLGSTLGKGGCGSPI